MQRTVSDAKFSGVHERLLRGSDPARRTSDLSILARFLVERASEPDLPHVVASVRGMGFDYFVTGETAPASASYELVRVRGGRPRRGAIELGEGASFPASRGGRSVWRLRGRTGTG